MATAPDPLYATVLGDDWADLHERIRERYGLTSADDRISIGSGRMDHVTAGLLARPALHLLALRDAGVAASGRDVPFEVRSYAFEDERGHEAIALRRRFEFPDRHRFFEDVTRWDPDRERMIDFLGTDGRLAVELDAAVEGGRLRFSFGDQWLWTGSRYRRVPDALAVDGAVVDSFDDDAGRYAVDATVESSFGTVFGFAGRFDTERADAPGVLPACAYAVADRPLPGR